MKKVPVYILILIFSCFLFRPSLSRAAVLQKDYPRLSNYFLRWEISDAEARELAKWDLLILDMEIQENSRRQLETIRRLNPEITILAYITSQEILGGVSYYRGSTLRQEIERNINDGWWLKDTAGNKISNWPKTYKLNLSDGAKLDSRGYRFNDYLPEFVNDKIKAGGLWDGVFYDNTWGEISWLNGGNFDLNNDGRRESAAEANRLWMEGVRKMLLKTRRLVGDDFIIMGNGKVYEGYKDIINGMMLEDFPSLWESNGSWSGSMSTYWRLPAYRSPAVSVFNVLNTNRYDYRAFRFGLSSALMGEGFYGFDYGVTDHGQTWWYDEYDVKLGPAQSTAYNLLKPGNLSAQSGLWRRDFKNGIAVVNSTDRRQTYAFDKEEFEKIKGTQDKTVNNGQRVNYVQLAPKDGVVLLKSERTIEEVVFTNGYFYRVFNTKGEQTRNGFFAYLKAYPGQAEIITASGPDGSQSIELSAATGRIDLVQNGGYFSSFNPYNQLYRKQMSLAAKVEDGYFRKIIVGAGLGGGPQVLIFSPTGRLEGGFFAYNKALRGGVNVALGDVDGNGEDDIITGPGPGEEPRVKVFSASGQLKSSFLAYDPRFRGGVNVAVGDINGDGRAEIITAPASAGGPHIRIFTCDGRVLSSFFAYDQKYRGGVKVSVAYDSDGRAEILAGIKDIY